MNARRLPSRNDAYMNLHQVFGPIQPLQDFQVERLTNLQAAFEKLVQVIIANTPSVPSQKKALKRLRQAYLQAQDAVRQPHSIVDITVLSRIFAAHICTVKRIWFNVVDYANVRKFDREHLEIFHDAIRLRQGIQGRIFGAEIRLRKTIPMGHAVLIGMNQDDADLQPDWTPDPSQLVRLYP